MKARGPWWGWVWVVRRVGKRLDRLADAMEAQNALLTRLADQFAPVIDRTPVNSAEVTVDFADMDEQAAILAYIQRTAFDTGRPPTEDEIVAYLAEEATQAHHRRVQG